MSPTYSKDWDGAIHDYFVLRCESFTVSGTWTPEQLAADEGITQFRWWTLADMAELSSSEEFRPKRLPALIRDLIEGSSTCPIDI